jgi:hypothetical protein
MWSAVGHIRMDVVQHDTLPEHARMTVWRYQKVPQNCSALILVKGPLDAKAPKDSRGSWDGVKNLVMQWFWL